MPTTLVTTTMTPHHTTMAIATWIKPTGTHLTPDMDMSLLPTFLMCLLIIVDPQLPQFVDSNYDSRL